MEVLKRYCVDSDILIDYLRGFEPARSFLLKSGEEALLNVSVVSIAEIYAGKETASAIKRLLIDQFLSNFYMYYILNIFQYIYINLFITKIIIKPN